MSSNPRRARNRTRDLFLWLNAVKADRELPPSAFLVAYEIGQHFNSRHGGAAWPGLETIAASIGLDKATVIRAVKRLRQRGHLLVEPGRSGRGHSNRYRMPPAGKIKGAAAHLSEPAKGAPAPRVKGALVSLKGAPAHLNHLEPSKCGEAKGSPHRERVVALRATDPPGALAPDGGAPEEKTSGLPSKQDSEIFAGLWALWARPWLDDEAEASRAFIKATSAGADPADIIAGAQAWVDAVVPRFRKPLEKWLAAHGWEKPPPQRRQRKGKNPPMVAAMLKAGQS
jgi:Helix-turn-helix domain